MRVLLSTYDSRGRVEPLVALGVRVRASGAEVLVCAPPDCAERLARVGLPLVPAGAPVRALVHRATPPSPDDVPRLTAELIATWFHKVAAAAVVHHGGAGTTTTATRAGAPQVVVPQWADQPYWARRVADLGVGVAHAARAPTTESLSVALRTALTAQTSARAAVAGLIRTDGATVAATLLVDAISRPRPPVRHDGFHSRRRPATSDRS
jgi:UDP:flavonoid glycosyltransferase YjiC (YdhE family)